MKVSEAKQITGGLSNPSKMPGHAYSLPAQECNVGAKLRKQKGSVCEKCYALKGRYVFPNVKDALYKRLDALKNPRWIDAMAFLVNRYCANGFFRWHDSGDLQSLRHLEMICAVCELTPDVKHWLPTREYSIVRQYVEKYGAVPSNLTVRLSAYMVDGPKPLALANKLGVQISSVSTDGLFTCPSSLQGNSCGDCRACWDQQVEDVTYKKH